MTSQRSQNHSWIGREDERRAQKEHGKNLLHVVRCLPQDFAKFLSGRCHITFVAQAVPAGGGAAVVPVSGR